MSEPSSVSVSAHAAHPANSSPPPTRVAVVMGSVSDWDVLSHAVAVLDTLGIARHVQVLSAHRMPDEMFAFAEKAQSQGFAALIAGAGGAAHLPGMLAAKTQIPVLGVPVPSAHLQGLDSLYSIVQMPKGIPVATFAIGVSGAANAALFAAALLALHDPALATRLNAFRQAQHEAACQSVLPPATHA